MTREEEMENEFIIEIIIKNLQNEKRREEYIERRLEKRRV